MESQLTSFEEVVLPHLGAAYNLARWLTRNDADAEDVVQESYLRAFKYFSSFHGNDGRPWLLSIVRNTFYTWTRQNRVVELQTPLDDERHSDNQHDPETRLIEKTDSKALRKAMDELSAEFREVIVLRELEGLSYKQIADVAEIPLGTVMSRLARARKHLQQSLTTGHRYKEISEEIAVGAF